jgi:hypothetical protein
MIWINLSIFYIHINLIGIEYEKFLLKKKQLCYCNFDMYVWHFITLSSYLPFLLTFKVYSVSYHPNTGITVAVNYLFNINMFLFTLAQFLNMHGTYVYKAEILGTGNLGRCGDEWWRDTEVFCWKYDWISVVYLQSLLLKNALPFLS